MIPQKLHTGEPPSECFRVGEWFIDPALDEISRGNEVVKLEPRTMRLLCRLAEARGHVVSSQQLLESVWSGVIVGSASVYQAISSLRKILGDNDATPTYIATVLRKGYRLIAKVEGVASVTANASENALSSAANPVHRRRALRLGVAAGAFASLALIIVVILAMTQREGPMPSPSAPIAVAWPAPDLPSIAVLPFKASVPDDTSEMFAICITDLLQVRLARQEELLSVSVSSAETLKDPRLDVRDLGKRLHAKYLLRGDASQAMDQLRVNVALLETSSGAAIWSKSYARTAREVTALREEIVARVGAELKVRIGSVGNASIDLAAYELYMRGRLEAAKGTEAGFLAAKDIYERATVLHPDFAPAYEGWATSLSMMSYAAASVSETVTDAAKRQELEIKALDRALELDPEYGEAMIQRAGYIEDPVKAEEMYRRGLDLVPSFDIGPLKFSEFLWCQGRSGEAVDVINRGLRVDPLSPFLLWSKAGMLLDTRGDIAGHDAVLRELLAAHPDFGLAISGLGFSGYVWGGETAKSIGLFEQLIAQDPGTLDPRRFASAAYLDVDDLAAAISAAKGLPHELLEIAQFRREAHPIAAIPVDIQSWEWLKWGSKSVAPIGDALRDEAIATGNYAPALAAFEKVRSDYHASPLGIRGMELVHAHTLILSGDTERGRELARSLLRMLDAEEIGRPKHWFARDRASIYVMLGDDERALSELAESVRRKDFVRWWYTAELDPLFTHLRKDPRFQALAAEVKQHRLRQRVLLEEMRRKGEVPKRP